MSEFDKMSGTPASPTGRPIAELFAQGFASPQLGALLTLASAMTLGIGLIVWSMKPDYVPVSESANRQDALDIIEVLRSSQTDYKIDPSTGLVLVPRDELSQSVGQSRPVSMPNYSSCLPVGNRLATPADIGHDDG